MKSGSSAILLLKSPAKRVSQSFGILFNTSVRSSSVVAPESFLDALYEEFSGELYTLRRIMFLWSPKNRLSNLIPWISVHSGTMKLEQPGVRDRWYPIQRPPEFDGFRSLLRHLNAVELN